MYGACRRWPPNEFKSNLQAYFLLNSVVVFASHALSGHYTTAVWRNFLWGFPGALLGLIVGLLLSNHINPDHFRKLVLVLLLFLGLRLLFG